MAPGFCAAGVHDAGLRVTALAPEAVVEPDTESAQLRDPGRSLLRQQLHGAGTAETAARGERVGSVERGVVSRTDRGGHAPLGRVAVRAPMRGLREHEHRGPCVGRREGGGEARDSGSRDDDVTSPTFLPHKR